MQFGLNWASWKLNLFSRTFAVTKRGNRVNHSKVAIIFGFSGSIDISHRE